MLLEFAVTILVLCMVTAPRQVEKPSLNCYWLRSYEWFYILISNMVPEDTYLHG
jgi:hypothetical protein